jgi:hypothetical protein
MAAVSEPTSTTAATYATTYGMWYRHVVLYRKLLCYFNAFERSHPPP